MQIAAISDKKEVITTWFYRIVGLWNLFVCFLLLLENSNLFCSIFTVSSSLFFCEHCIIKIHLTMHSVFVDKQTFSIAIAGCMTMIAAVQMSEVYSVIIMFLEGGYPQERKTKER